MHISYIIYFFRSIWHFIIEVPPFVCLYYLGEPPQSPVASLRRLLAAVSVGRDASALFPDVVTWARKRASAANGAWLVVATRGLYIWGRTV